MNVMFALFDMGGGQILLILALILIFFGAKRIPDLAKGLGQGIKEFKKATREVTEEIHNAAESSPPPPAPSQMRPNMSPAPAERQVADSEKTIIDPQRDPVHHSTEQKA
jgi:sec-independent protein translocase protein TatA